MMNTIDEERELIHGAEHIQPAEYCLCLPHYGPLVWQGMKELNGRAVHTHLHRFDEQLWEHRMRVLAEVNERIERRLQG